MADTETAPAPATPAAAPEAPAPVEQFSIPTEPKAYAAWKQGKPDDKSSQPPNKEDSASSKPPNKEDSASSKPADDKQQVNKSNSDTRVQDLLAERAAQRTELESLRAKLKTLETGKSDAKPAESSTAPVKHARAESSTAPDKEPVEPNDDDFDSWQDLAAARKKYTKDFAQWSVRQALAEEREQQRQESNRQHMTSRLDEAKSRYGETAEKTILDTAQSITGDESVPAAIKAAVGRSDVLVDALYVIGSDTKSFQEFMQLCQTDPLEGIRQWYEVERLVREELGKTQKTSAGMPARGPDGKFLAEKPAPARPRTAPPPPHEVNGNSAPPADERERAAKSGDFRAFKQAGDAKDALRWK